jgi:uroporphyrinogen-III synthase
MTFPQSAAGHIGAEPGPAPRAGWRALVTRPREDAEGLRAALATRGIEPIVEPLLDIRFRTGAVPELAGVAALLFTSANGVRAFARVMQERALPVFAVGEATAARARAEGFAIVESAGGNVADLAMLVRQRLQPDAGRLLHVAGTLRAGDLSGDLQAAGFTVERAVLYEAAPAGRLSAATIQAVARGVVDFALFFSPRTAAIFARLAEQAELLDKLRFVQAVSISAAADAALDEVRFRARHIAARPDQEGLLTVLDQLTAERRRA